MTAPSADPFAGLAWRSAEEREAEERDARRAFRRQMVGWGLLVAAVAAAAILAVSPAPYVVERPGPAYDTLGSTVTDGVEQPLIDIPDATTYPVDGELSMLTVYVDGSRERPLAWLDIAIAWLDPSRAVLPVEAVFPEGQTEEQSDEENAQAMVDSQQDAVAAALTELGVEYGSVVTVAQVLDDGAAADLLEAGDNILDVDGQAVTTVDELRAALAASGVGVPVDLALERDGEPVAVTVTPTASETDGSPVLGIYAGAEYDFPYEVDVRLQGVGGPSAGMMFALAIYDRLTPGALSGGEEIAGTGTISAGGEVGAIGGIVQKAFGARDAGADWLLLPTSNCAELSGRVPSGIEAFTIDDLDDAIALVDAIGSGDDLSGFPRCE